MLSVLKSIWIILYCSAVYYLYFTLLELLAGTGYLVADFYERPVLGPVIACFGLAMIPVAGFRAGWVAACRAGGGALMGGAVGATTMAFDLIRGYPDLHGVISVPYLAWTLGLPILSCMVGGYWYSRQAKRQAPDSS